MIAHIVGKAFECDSIQITQKKFELVVNYVGLWQNVVVKHPVNLLSLFVISEIKKLGY
jgi:hypothetical protein